MLRQIRDGTPVTAELVAAAMRARGHGWHQPTVTMLEQERRGLSLGELNSLADALSELGLGDQFDELLKAVRKGRTMHTMTMKQADLNVDRYGRAKRKAVVPSLDSHDAEARMARSIADRLNRPVGVGDVREWARTIWGRSLMEEREARVAADPDSTPRASRMRIARELQVEMLAHAIGYTEWADSEVSAILARHEADQAERPKKATRPKKRQTRKGS